MTSQNQARLQLVFAALLFSTGGAAIKASTLSGWQVASFRSGVAALTLLLLVPAARRGWGWRPALVGVAYAATLILFVTANKLTTSANTIFLQATSPVYLLLLGPLFLKEPVRRSDLWVVTVDRENGYISRAAGHWAAASHANSSNATACRGRAMVAVTGPVPVPRTTASLISAAPTF